MFAASFDSSHRCPYWSKAAAFVLAAGLSTAASAQTPPGALQFEPAILRDPMAAGAGQQALRFLKPVGWRVEGSIVWHHEQANLAGAEFKVTNPNGPEQVEFLPVKPYFWMPNPVMPMPRGTNYLGCEIQPPLEDPKQFVQYFILPQQRRSGVQFVSYQELPDVAKAVGTQDDLSGAKLRAGRTRISYTQDGQAMEEDLYVVLALIPNPYLQGAVIWGPERAFSLRAKAGQLDRETKKLLTIVNSIRVSQDWYGQYKYVVQLFNNRQQVAIDDARRLSEQLTRNAAEIRQMYRQAWENQQASQDRISSRFSQYIRGVERYSSPFEKYPVDLPAGYGQAWATADGRYLVSDQAGFNPNVGSTIQWQPLKRVD